MAEENKNVYGVQNNEGNDHKGVVNPENKDVKENGGVIGTGGNPSAGTGEQTPKENEKPAEGIKGNQDQDKETPSKQQAWDGKATDVDKQRTLDITESDGTAIKLVMHFPGIFEAENILGKQVSSFTNDAGDTVEQSTMGDFHKALLRLFGTATVNGAVKNLDEGFFYEHEIQTYNYAMRQATSFLSNPNGAFKA